MMAQDMQEEAFQRVRENFQRMEAFGWFSPFEFGTKNSYSWAKDESTGGPWYGQAAVLFLISYYKDDLHVLITKRSFSVSTHKGEECLPGGIREDGDTGPVDTALREAEEEVGLEPGLVELVSVLPSLPSGMNKLVCISPVVCLLKCSVEELKLVPNPNEVEAISWIPIRTFVESHTMKAARRRWKGVPYAMVGFLYVDPETAATCHVWGITGRICITLSAIALDQIPSFPDNSFANVDVVVTDKAVTVVVHSVALTSKHVEQWKHCPPFKSRLPIRQWHDVLSSKL